ncbi:TolC family protein [Halanaerobium hydrogeniformans]|uniref:Outer membrane efflux protein n=1 Tax=Halanaerobium hydrogeniformans TaxID=656519 RepID=E4RMY7_HALHG|nr:TolC family protein [Halanaerobium hydrogeniformans]ADQ14204.1 hypothetical protein Halsa_0756 [Halanaerobium hydrogeniformans]
MKAKIAIILVFFFSLLFLVTGLQAAEHNQYNLEEYLKEAVEKSRELEDFKLALLEKEINLKTVKADQEVSPSPLNLRQAELELELAEKELEKKKADLIYQFLNDFFNYYKTENLIALHQRYLETFKIEFANIQQKYEEGILIKSDIFQAEVELNRVEANLKAAKRDHNKISYKLKDNLGLSYDRKLKITFSEADLKDFRLDKSLDSLFELALDNRIEVESAEVNNELQEINYRLAQQDYNPWLQEKRAENEYLKAKNNLALTKSRIKIDLNNHYQDYYKSKADIESQLKLKASFEEALRVKKLYFTEDYISGTEFLEAKNDLYNAEINYLHTRIDNYLALAELYLSAGDFKELFSYVEK